MNKHRQIVVIGGNGLIGTKLVNTLRQYGQEVVAASPSSGVNTITGEGLAKALTGAQVVVDVSNAPSWDDQAVLEFLKSPGVISWPRKRSLAWGIMSPCQSSALTAFLPVAISARKWPRKT